MSGALALIVVVVVASVSSGGGAPATDTTSSGGSPAAKTKALPGLNAPVRDGKFEFIVTKVRAGVSYVGPSGLNQKAQGQYILVTMTVKNIGNKAQTFDASNQQLHDGSKRTYDADSVASLYANEGHSTFLQSINPGNQVTGSVVFDVPTTVTPTEVELHDSVFSGGVTVRLAAT